MANILEATRSDEKKRERDGQPAKLKFTYATYASFVKNSKHIESLAKVLERYNTNYSALLNAVTKKEQADAEKNEREKITKSAESAATDKLIAEKIKNDEMIAKFVEPVVIIPRLNSLMIDVKPLAKRFGKLGNNYGVRAKKEFAPKALSIPKLISEICSETLSNAQMYNEEAMKVILQDGKNDEANKAVTDKLLNGANWRELPFQEIKEENVAIAMENNHAEEKQEVTVPSHGLTEQELSHRLLIAEAGERKAEIDELLKNQGTGLQFSTALMERRESISKMLSELTGITISAKKNETIQTYDMEKTPFQSQIEQIVGYTEPISKEEHDEIEASMNEFYNDPNVEEKRKELQLKEVLYIYNDPDTYKQVTKAERLDNERVAEKAQNLDVLDIEEDAKENEDTLIEIGALEQSEMLDKAIRANLKAIQDGANTQAEEIIIKQSAHEQANIIAQEEKERIEIIDASEEVSNMLFLNAEGKKMAEYLYLTKEGENQASLLFFKKVGENEAGLIQNGVLTQIELDRENKEIKNGADNQATELVMKAFGQVQAEEIETKREAIIQAGELLMENFANEQAEEIIVKKNAEEQAENLIVADFGKAQAEELAMKNNANEQATELMLRNIALSQAAELYERNMIITGANEQAKLLNNLNDEMTERKDVTTAIVYQDLAQQFTKPEEEQVSKPTNIIENIFQRIGAVRTDDTSRYGTQESNPRPLKIKGTTYNSITDHIGAGKLISLEDRKAKYQSLRDLSEQINSEFSFLNLDDKVSGRSLTA